MAEGQTLLIFWGYGTSDSGITIMSASSSTSILMSVCIITIFTAAYVYVLYLWYLLNNTIYLLNLGSL